VLDQDLVNAVQIAHLDQTDLVAAGIVHAYHTHHSLVLVQALLQLLFGVHHDIRNVLRECILHEFLTSHNAEEVLASIVRMVEREFIFSLPVSLPDWPPQGSWLGHWSSSDFNVQRETHPSDISASVVSP